MPHRFYVPDIGAVGDPVGGTVPLPAEEARHASRVLRLRIGAVVGLFDGRGGEYSAIVVDVGKTVVVRVEARRTAIAEPHVSITLVHAVLKGDKMDAVVRDAVMMGVASIQPVVTARSEVTVAALARGGRTERWRRVAVASAKQCGRAVVPEVGACRLLSETGEHGPLAAPAPRLALVEPAADVGATVDAWKVPEPVGRAATVIVGPEGGWTPEELIRLAREATLLSLGPRTLRADSAALVAVASLFAVWGGQSRPKAQGSRPKGESA